MYANLLKPYLIYVLHLFMYNNAEKDDLTPFKSFEDLFKLSTNALNSCPWYLKYTLCFL